MRKIFNCKDAMWRHQSFIDIISYTATTSTYVTLKPAFTLQRKMLAQNSMQTTFICLHNLIKHSNYIISHICSTIHVLIHMSCILVRRSWILFKEKEIDLRSPWQLRGPTVSLASEPGRFVSPTATWLTGKWSLYTRSPESSLLPNNVSLTKMWEKTFLLICSQ